LLGGLTLATDLASQATHACTDGRDQLAHST
jgi:hypothetical protein